MISRNARAQWMGGLKDGKGTVALGSGAFEGQYSFTSRFENGTGTNPEELLGAAHAGCFSMAFAGGLEKAGFKADSVATTAKISVDKVDGGFKVVRIDLVTEAKVPGITPEAFQEVAQGAKVGCPISKALASVEITLDAKLV
ncbi:MAG: OsmC family protein [Acidobacteriota bacterium]